MLHLVESHTPMSPDDFADAGLTVIQSGDAMALLVDLLYRMSFEQVHLKAIDAHVAEARRTALRPPDFSEAADEIDLAGKPDPDAPTVILTADQIADARTRAHVEVLLAGLDDAD